MGSEDLKYSIKEDTQHNPMDSAALAAGAIAAVLAVTQPKGPYDIMSAVIGTVIVLVLVAYERPAPRTHLQNVAFACILSLSSLPIAGYLLEVIFTAVRGELNPESLINGRIVKKGNEFDTAVQRWVIFLCWILLSILYFVFVWTASRRKTRRNSGPK